MEGGFVCVLSPISPLPRNVPVELSMRRTSSRSTLSSSLKEVRGQGLEGSSCPSISRLSWGEGCGGRPGMPSDEVFGEPHGGRKSSAVWEPSSLAHCSADSSTYATFLFNAFDTNHDGSVSFEVSWRRWAREAWGSGARICGPNWGRRLSERYLKTYFPPCLLPRTLWLGCP